MIDLLHILLPYDCSIADDADINLVGSTINLRTGELTYPVDLLYTTKNGDKVIGQKAYINDKLFNLSISPNRKKLFLNLQILNLYKYLK